MEINLNKRIGILEHISLVFKLLANNIIIIGGIALLINLPAIAVTYINPNIGNLLNAICTAIAAISVIKFTDIIIKGQTITFKEAIKTIKENPISYLGAFFIQYFIASLGMFIVQNIGITGQVGNIVGALFAQIVLLFLTVLMQYVILEQTTIIEGMKKSFLLIKRNPVSVFFKQFFLQIIIILIIYGMKVALVIMPTIGIIYVFVSLITTLLSAMSATVIFENLKNIKDK